MPQRSNRIAASPAAPRNDVKAPRDRSAFSFSYGRYPIRLGDLPGRTRAGRADGHDSRRDVVRDDAPGPITVLSPIVTPCITTVLPPIQTLLPMVMGSERMMPALRWSGSRAWLTGVEPHVGTDEDVVPDRHGGFVEDRQVEVADEMVADRDLLPEVAVERAVDGEIPADAPEQPADDRLALFAAARGQPVEFEDQFLGTPQGFADLRADGVEPEAAFIFSRSSIALS